MFNDERKGKNVCDEMMKGRTYKYMNLKKYMMKG